MTKSYQVNSEVPGDDVDLVDKIDKTDQQVWNSSRRYLFGYYETRTQVHYSVGLPPSLLFTTIVHHKFVIEDFPYRIKSPIICEYD